MVELEKRGVWDGFMRSFKLVRGHFWMVAAVVVPIETVGDGINEAIIEAGPPRARPRPARRAWVGEAIGNIITAPVFAVAVVLLTLDLIHHRDGSAPTLNRRPGAGRRRRSPREPALPLANFVTDFWSTTWSTTTARASSSSWSASSARSPSSA